MIILMTLLIAGTSMAFAVHQWWRGHHMIAIGYITFACLMAGVAVETAKNNSAPPVFGSQRVAAASDHPCAAPSQQICKRARADQSAPDTAGSTALWLDRLGFIRLRCRRHLSRRHALHLFATVRPDDLPAEDQSHAQAAV